MLTSRCKSEVSPSDVGFGTEGSAGQDRFAPEGVAARLRGGCPPEDGHFRLDDNGRGDSLNSGDVLLSTARFAGAVAANWEGLPLDNRLDGILAVEQELPPQVDAPAFPENDIVATPKQPASSRGY
mmetsp:Transcript_123751/g.240786  ORF Transcript_123751/g.240786 Transcript_123751/m.240786 type:complete len:126 (+) Transcript_123751:777-1154(+)